MILTSLSRKSFRILCRLQREPPAAAARLGDWN